ncbi:MAG: hypothetical protein LLG44_03635 [Chloroflexi bacterium]|nr:hypothetical protein [Chloroflexota bacterium]
MNTSKRAPWANTGLYILLYGLSVIYIGLGITRALNVYDEGLIVYGAQRVLWGDVPYRDFWTVYSPGQYYALAGLFKIFGSTILVERVWDTLFRAAVAVVSMALVQRLGSRGMGVITWLLVTLWLGFYEFYGYPVYIAMLLVLSSFLALLHLADSNHPRRMTFLAGLALGTATLFRHDFGAYALVAEVVAFLPLALTGCISLRGERSRHAMLRLGTPFLLGASIVVAPAAALLLAAVPATTLREDLIVFPITTFPLVRTLPYPKLLPQVVENWPYYFPYLILGLTALYLIIRLVRLRWRKLSPSEAIRLSGFAYLLLFAAVSLNQSRIRADLIHLVGLLVISFILCMALLGLAWKSGKVKGILTLCVALLLLAPFGQQIIDERVTLLERGIWANTPNTGHQIPAAWGMPVEPNQAAAIKYIREIVPADTPIYEATSRHDRIFVNDALFYFLAGRKCATRYNELHPGVATTQLVQEEIVSDLERLQTPVIVRFSMFEDVVEPNDSGKSSGIKIVDIYLNQNYKVDRIFGPYYQILKRQPG